MKAERYQDAAVHELKTQPDPFNAILANVKPYEVRSNLDRRFEVGDHLVLREWVPAGVDHVFEPIWGSNGQVCGRCSRAPGEHAKGGNYTGRVAYRTIGYITRGGTWGLPTDVDVLGFETRPWVPR